MTVLLQAALETNNIFYTLLLVMVIFYWGTVILGVLDISSLDFDLDLDADVDIDSDIDVDTDIDGGGGSWLGRALQFFNFGQVPFMIIMSFVILFQWALSVLCNHYLGDGSIFFAIALMIPMLFVSLVMTKIITTPLIPVFKNMNEGEESIDYIGLTCTVLLAPTTDKMGQAEVVVNNNPLLINIKSKDENQAFTKGYKALIVNQLENYFIIQNLS